MLPCIHPDRMQIAFDDHLPISPCVNARAHRFGGFGIKQGGYQRPLVRPC